MQAHPSRVVTRLIASSLLATALAGCAGVPIERGRDAVADALQARHHAAFDTDANAGELDDATRALLAEPLSADAAVALAWRHGARANEAMARLGLAAADLFESQRPRNPGIEWSRVGSEYTLGLHAVVSDLLTLPARRRVGELQWQAAIAGTVDALLDSAADARRAYYRAMAAEQIAELRAGVAEAAELSAELARRFHAAGNISALQLAREEANATQARSDAASARAERLAARMQLAERIGLAGRSNRWSLPARLPLPQPLAADVDRLLATAVERPDRIAAQAALDARGRDARRIRATAWLGDLELGVEREREHGEHRSGPSIAIALPLFSQGQAERARASAQTDIATQQLAAIDLQIQRDVRSGFARLNTQAEIVDSYLGTLIPQREAIVERELERYNFMLIGVFELLQARSDQFDSWQAAIEAVRDWWIAHAELERAIGAPVPLSGDDPGHVPRPQDIVAPPQADDDPHRHH